MKTINIDAANWRTRLDVYEALLPALGAPDWHGQSLDALVDSVIWGGINEIDAPLTIHVSGLSKASAEARDETQSAKKALMKARLEFRAAKGHDVMIQFEIDE